MSIKSRLQALEQFAERQEDRGLRVVYQWGSDDYASEPQWASGEHEHYTAAEVKQWSSDGFTVLRVVEVAQ